MDSDALELCRIQEQIKTCCEELEAVYNEFNMVNDPDMIDNCIYKMNALESRHRALLSQYKAIS